MSRLGRSDDDTAAAAALYQAIIVIINLVKEWKWSETTPCKSTNVLEVPTGGLFLV